MQKRTWPLSALIVALSILLITTSCSKKSVKKGKLSTGQGISSQSGGSGGQTDSDEAAARKKELEEEALRQKREAEKAEFENKLVLFGYNSATLDAAAQNVLREKAKWLSANQTDSVLIQGHADERGTVEYNLALGDQRAEAAKRFLVNLGIESSRMITISYGEERPLDPRQVEDAFAKNRRCHFVIN